MLFTDVYERYVADKSERVRASTLEGYVSSARLHLLPALGGRRIEDLGPDNVQALVDSIPRPGAAEKAYKTLRQIIRWAIRKLGVRMYDPTMAGIELPRRPARRPAALDAAGERGYLRALWGHECEAVAICSVTLGLRRGEACGLRWEDIDLRTGEVRVRRSRQVVRGETVEVPPKTDRSVRSCWLPRFALRRLRSIRRGARGLLCDLSPDAIARRIKAACRRAGAPWVSMTSCRHTWATLAICGRAFDPDHDCISVMNASWKETGVLVTGAVYNADDAGSIYVFTASALPDRKWLRVNYTVTLGA